MGLLMYRSTELDSRYIPTELNLGRRTRCNLPRHGDNASKTYDRHFEKDQEKKRNSYQNNIAATHLEIWIVYFIYS